MKIRQDYVSNSSSASFVIKDNAAEATKMFLADFGEYIADSFACSCLFGDELEVGYVVEGQNDNWPVYTTPDKFATALSGGREDKEFPDDSVEAVEPNKIKELHFECDDWNKTGMLWICFLREYFEKFGFNTDTSDSERSFGDNPLTKIMSRLQPIKP
jgi:hypothetical protein